MKMPTNLICQEINKPWEPLELPDSPITRGRLKKFKEAVQGLMKNVSILRASDLEELGLKGGRPKVLNNVILVSANMRPQTKKAHHFEDITLRPFHTTASHTTVGFETASTNETMKCETTNRYSETA